MATDVYTSLSPVAERELYLQGIRLFNSHAFFEAHEAWEDVWRTCLGVKREFYQGLIQCAVALEHYRRGNPRGVINLHKSSEKHFSNVPPSFMGVDVERFRQGMRVALEPVLGAYPPARRGEIELDQAIVPQLVLLADPFER